MWFSATGLCARRSASTARSAARCAPKGTSFGQEASAERFRDAEPDSRPLGAGNPRSQAERRRHGCERATTAERTMTGQADPRHAARVFQMGSAESGSTIKVRSAVRPQTASQRMVVRVPPFDHPKVTRHNGRSMDRLPDVMVDDHKLAGRCFHDCRWRSARPGSRTSTPTSAASRTAHAASPPR